ncbi:MAG TPA: alanine--glyoxylate aminotransferase family protein [Acidimicrobiales bacterium]|nr:alanine--glyoxylate aminotransferase family protein [Acidimicrobiales bacterium]
MPSILLMALEDRILMGPGPSNPYPEVAAAFVRPVLGHLDPAFLEVLDETCDRLRTAFRTTNSLTFPLSGTGSAGMEASFVNFVRPGDPVVVGVNGLFGERMCEVASRQGAQVIRVEAPWGEPIDPLALLEAHPDPVAIAVVHAETSTGVLNSIEPLHRGKGDAILIADTVTSLCGVEVDVGVWDVDVAYSATQKCLGVPPGLAPLTVSPRALEKRVERPSSWYFDLGLISGYVEAGVGRTYHHTAPISMVYALHAGLGAILDEGLEFVWERHLTCGVELQQGLLKLGLELLAPEGHRLPQLTSVLVPDDLPAGLDEAGVRSRLLREYGIEIGAGVGPLAGKIWRIGCMGHTARMRNVKLLVGALGEVLER